MVSKKGYALCDVILGIAILIPICSASTAALLHIKKTVTHAQDNWTHHPKLPVIRYKNPSNTPPHIKKIAFKNKVFLKAELTNF